MKKILKTHTREEIAKICEVSPKTVYNWTKLDTIPLRAIKKLGFDLKKLHKPINKAEV